MPTVMREMATVETEAELLAMSRDECIEDLTERERMFCEYYIGKWNIKTAAIKAGYAKKSAHYVGWRIRNKPSVNRYICWLKLRISKSCHIKAVDMIDLYVRVAYADITDIVSVVDGKLTVKNTDEIDGQIINKIKQGRDGITVELEDRKWACNKLERYFDVMPKDWKQEIEERKLKILEERLNIEKKKLGEVEEWEDDGFLEAIQDMVEEVWGEDGTDEYEEQEES